MSAPSIETAQAWQGRTMVDPAGDKLGTIDAIYLDDETGQPEWARSPAACSRPRPPSCRSPRPRPWATASRCPTTSSRSPTPPACRPTGASPRTTRPSCTATTAWTTPSHRSDSGLPAGTADDRRDDTVGRDTSGPTTDEAMTRSEEELRVGTETRERGRARLRKYVTTETQQVTVPVLARGGPGRARADHRRQPGRRHQRPGHLRGGARGHPPRGGGRGREAGRAQGAGPPGHRDRHRGAPGLRGGPQGADPGRRPGPAPPPGPALGRTAPRDRGRRSSGGPARLPKCIKEQHCDS